MDYISVTFSQCKMKSFAYAEYKISDSQLDGLPHRITETVLKWTSQEVKTK